MTQPRVNFRKALFDNYEPEFTWYVEMMAVINVGFGFG